MPHMREDETGYWKAFKEWSAEVGVNLEAKDDWEMWWQCWNAALDARDAEDMNKFGQGEEEDKPDISRNPSIFW